ncbi:MAG: hypothetical protein K9N07_04435 [Candidatus Cloacimonetes bacterium]|nr:hypothetical protein [Candidatus Cloacimonadota bacterium]
MKKISILAILFFCMLTSGLIAQETGQKIAEYPVAFQPGEKIVQAGLGFGMMGVYGDVVIPPLSVSIDIAKEIEGFPISFGGIIGLAKSEYDWYYRDDYKWTYTYFLLGGRAAYHLKLKSEKIDPYGGLMLGYNIVSYKEPLGWVSTNSYSGGSSYLMYGFYAGARYFINPKMAVYVELGYGFGYLNLGISYKL